MLGNQHVVPILMRPGSKRVREASSAPEASADMYDAVPVESFGEALLRGMGFDPDKHKTKPVWHDKPRDNLLGLGAKALLPHEKMIVTGKGKSKGTSRPLGGASAGSVTSSTTLPSSAAEGDDRAEAAGEVQDGAPAERSPANAAGVSSAGGPAAQDEKRRRIAAAGASGASNGSQAKNGRNHVWASRGLVVRIVGKAGQLREFFGLEAVVLEADEASGLCRIKARKGDTSHTLPGVGIADLETRVSRACSAVRIVRGAHRGKTTDLVRRDVQRGIALVRLGGEETELQLDDVCQFMA